MQWLSLVTEDYGVQRLKADNLRPVVARPLAPVAAYPAAHPVQTGETPEAPQQPRAERRRGERRQGGERRRRQVPVILDTRCQNDRRASTERRDGAGSAPRLRLDTYA